MPPDLNPSTVPGGVVIPTWVLLAVVGAQQVAIYRLVATGRSDLKLVLPLMREVAGLLADVKEFLK